MNVDHKTRKVVLELLQYCNLECKHCIYRLLNKSHSFDFLPKENTFKLIDKFSKDNIDKLVFTGGEPTLHPSFIEISKYTISKIPKVSICTNGVIPNKDLRDKVIELNFSNYTVSVDSHINQIHDEFRGVPGALKQSIDFLEKLKSKKRKIAIHITLHPNNIDLIEDTIKFCKNFTSEIAVGSVYHNILNVNFNKLTRYDEKIEKFKEKYINNPEVIIIGFTPFCKSKNCLDQKNVFMFNYKGEMVECYWKKIAIR